MFQNLTPLRITVACLVLMLALLVVTNPTSDDLQDTLHDFVSNKLVAAGARPDSSEYFASLATANSEKEFRRKNCGFYSLYKLNEPMSEATIRAAISSKSNGLFDDVVLVGIAEQFFPIAAKSSQSGCVSILGSLVRHLEYGSQGDVATSPTSDSSNAAVQVPWSPAPAPFPDMTQYEGRDLCEVMSQLDDSSILKQEFTTLFGDDRWATWTGYSAECQPIAATSDAELGSLLVITRHQEHAAFMSAALVIRPTGEILGVCFSDGSKSEWLGVGWKKSNESSDCDVGTTDSNKIANLKSAHNSTAPSVKKQSGMTWAQYLFFIWSNPNLVAAKLLDQTLSDTSTK